MPCTPRRRQTRRQLTDSMKMFRMGLEQWQAIQRPCRRSAGMVLQGQRHQRRRSRRRSGQPGFLRRWRRGTGDRGDLRHRPGWNTATARGICARKRVFRPHNGTPELSVPGPFQAAPGILRAGTARWRPAGAASRAPAGSIRNGSLLWEKPFLSGESNMSHTLANLEHHHFKYDLFCQPGDVHVHMFGTATLSFADGISCEEGDVVEIAARGFGVPLKNRLSFRSRRTMTA